MKKSTLSIVSIVVIALIIFSIVGSSLTSNRDDTFDDYYIQVENGTFGYYVMQNVTDSNSIHTDDADAEYYGSFSIYMNIRREEWDLLNSGDDVKLYRINGRLYCKARDIEKLVRE